jgi:hypothetical protein
MESRKSSKVRLHSTQNDCRIARLGELDKMNKKENGKSRLPDTKAPVSRESTTYPPLGPGYFDSNVTFGVHKPVHTAALQVGNIRVTENDKPKP